MYRFLMIPVVFTLLAVSSAFPTDLIAEEDTTCKIKATKDVYVEAHYLRGRDESGETHKSGMIWSGNLGRGGMVSITATDGRVHLTYRDLTESNPRTENQDVTCRGNTILVPR
ncbi:MAG: hypothetical protein JJV98_05105 [Desulfosarcina sp.]|nr:hypothetical protein [Desulfobacterales bacterium]